MLFHGLSASMILLALLVSVFPIPPQYQTIRPEFICLILIYWIIFTPQRIGMVYAACVGLLQDIAAGAVWGAHMMALVIVSYICILSYQRFQSYSIWHQSLWVFVLIGMHQSVVNWIQGLNGYSSDVAALIVSTLVTALFWPVVFLLMSRLRQFYRIH